MSRLFKWIISTALLIPAFPWQQAGAAAALPQISISSGVYHNMAAKADGTVWTWGGNVAGEIGNGTIKDTPNPTQVEGLYDVAAIFGGHAYSMALTTDKTVWAWGNNGAGQLGDGTYSTRTRPVRVKDPSDPSGNLTGVKQLSLGGQHTMALKEDGSVWSWGYNNRGQLGYQTIPTLLPARVPLGENGTDTMKQVFAKGDYTAVLSTTGSVYTFGENADGQLGDGTRNSRLTPNLVADPENNLSAPWKGVDAVAGGIYHVLALKGGAVWAWGFNGDGQLGDATYQSRYTPVQVKSSNGIALRDVKSIAAGWNFSFAVKIDGTLWAWGNNGAGQLGDGTITSRNEAVQVKGPDGLPLTGISKVTAGLDFAIALQEDGTIWAWGNKQRGALGIGTVQTSSVPVKVQLYAVNADLTGLQLSAGNLEPDFASVRTDYTATVDDSVSSMSIIPTFADIRATASVSANGGPAVNVGNGQTSSLLPLNTGENVIQVLVRAENPSFSKMYQVKVTRSAPVNKLPAAADLSFTTQTHTPVSGVLLASDPDNDALQYALIGLPSKGKVTIQADTGEFTYIPNIGETGIDIFTYKASDGKGGSNIATVTITIAETPNVIPQAFDFGITVVNHQAYELKFIGADADSGPQPLTFHVVDQPSKGSLSAVSNDVFNYTPNEDAEGVDIFTYQAYDGKDYSSVQTVTVMFKGPNRLPRTAYTDIQTTKDTPVTTKLFAEDQGNDALQYTIIGTPDKGDIQLNKANGILTYTPKTGVTGTDTVYYQVFDGKAYSNAQSIKVTINEGPNEPPVIQDVNLMTTKNTVVVMALTAADAENGNLEFFLLSKPTRGTLSIVGNKLTYTPHKGEHGTVSFLYQVSDGQNLSNIGTITIFIKG